MKNNFRKNDIMLRNNGDEFALFNPFFDDFFGMPSLRKECNEFNKVMKTDIKEGENSYELEVDMPGFDKKDINLKLENGYLSISAEKQENNDEKDKKGNYIRRERRYGSCSRNFYVGDVKEEDINAKLEHGVLTIEVPKENKKVDSTKRIEIK